MHVRHPKNVDVSPTDLALTYRQYAQPKKKMDDGCEKTFRHFFPMSII